MVSLLHRATINKTICSMIVCHRIAAVLITSSLVFSRSVRLWCSRVCAEKGR